MIQASRLKLARIESTKYAIALSRSTQTVLSQIWLKSPLSRHPHKITFETTACPLINIPFGFQIVEVCHDFRDVPFPTEKGVSMPCFSLVG
jgi:hypothetical protein